MCLFCHHPVKLGVNNEDLELRVFLFSPLTFRDAKNKPYIPVKVLDDKSFSLEIENNVLQPTVSSRTCSFKHRASKCYSVIRKKC